MAALVAAAIMVASFGYYVVALPDVPSPPVVPPPDERWAAWMYLPQLATILIGGGIPALGGSLLLSRTKRRREVGAAAVAAYGAPLLLSTPSQVLTFTRPGDVFLLAMNLSFVVFGLIAAAAAVLAAAALVTDESVRWTDPRRAGQSAERLVLLGAVALTTITYFAPLFGPPGEPLGPWFGGLFAAGLDPSSVLQQMLFLLPAVAVVAVGVAAAGAQPVRVAVAAGFVIAVEGMWTVVGSPLSNVKMARLWDQHVEPTLWFWVHAVAVFALVGALAALWWGRAQDREDARVGAA